MTISWHHMIKEGLLYQFKGNFCIFTCVDSYGNLKGNYAYFIIYKSFVNLFCYEFDYTVWKGKNKLGGQVCCVICVVCGRGVVPCDVKYHARQVFKMAVLTAGTFRNLIELVGCSCWYDRSYVRAHMKLCHACSASRSSVSFYVPPPWACWLAWLFSWQSGCCNK